MATGKRARETAAHLGATESDLAGRVVFTWSLVPAADRLVHALEERHDAHDAVEELRAVVRLLDRLGWPGDRSEATRLTSCEVAVVRAAARSQLGRGLDPDRGARGRIARGPAIGALPHRDSVAALLDALEAPGATGRTR